MLTIACSLMSGHGKGKVCLLMLEVDMGSNLESQLGHNGDMVHQRHVLVSSEKNLAFKVCCFNRHYMKAGSSYI